MKDIEIKSIVVSSENPDDRYSGKSFAELVASVKEKGVLMPILVRTKGQKFEVVAGARRLKAAQEVGLKKIPARVVKMTDTEAREARIVENLQRKDVHPLEEGEAYRTLIESGNKTKYDIKELAQQVGKSEKYVRDRMVLTNLTEKAKKLVREKKMPLTHAVIIARVDEAKQKKVLTPYIQEYHFSRDQLVDQLEENTFKELMKSPPWKDDEQIKSVLDEGDLDGEQVDLFGKKADDEYRDPIAFARKMAAYIQMKIKEAKDAKTSLLKISTDWGDAKTKGVLSKNDYSRLESKADQKTSKNPQNAIVVEGSDLGMIYVVTIEKEELNTGHYAGSTYKLSAKEKKQRQDEREETKKKAEAHQKLITKIVAKVEKSSAAKDKKMVKVLYEMKVKNVGSTVTRPICKRRGIEAIRVKDSWGGDGTHLDYSLALEKAAKKMSTPQLMGVVVEAFCNSVYDMESVKKIDKILSTKTKKC